MSLFHMPTYIVAPGQRIDHPGRTYLPGDVPPHLEPVALAALLEIGVLVEEPDRRRVAADEAPHPGVDSEWERIAAILAAAEERVVALERQVDELKAWVDRLEGEAAAKDARVAELESEVDALTRPAPEPIGVVAPPPSPEPVVVMDMDVPACRPPGRPRKVA